YRFATFVIQPADFSCELSNCRDTRRVPPYKSYDSPIRELVEEISSRHASAGSISCFVKNIVPESERDRQSASCFWNRSKAGGSFRPGRRPCPWMRTPAG